MQNHVSKKETNMVENIHSILPDNKALEASSFCK